VPGLIDGQTQLNPCIFGELPLPGLQHIFMPKVVNTSPVFFAMSVEVAWFGAAPSQLCKSFAAFVFKQV
jgi:hypothetical protein